MAFHREMALKNSSGSDGGSPAATKGAGTIFPPLHDQLWIDGPLTL